MNKLKNTQASHPALQAARRPTPTSRFFAGGLTDWLRRSQTRQMCLLDAARGIHSVPLPVQAPEIHNSRLSIILQGKTHLVRTTSAHLSGEKGAISKVVPLYEQVCSGTRTELRQNRLECHSAKWREAPAGFSLDRAGYTLTKKTRGRRINVLSIPIPRFRPLLDTRPVKAASRNVPQRSNACLLTGIRCTQRSHQMVSGADQVTRTAPDTILESEVR